MGCLPSSFALRSLPSKKVGLWKACSPQPQLIVTDGPLGHDIRIRVLEQDSTGPLRLKGSRMGKRANPRRVDIPSSTAQTPPKDRDCVCWFMTVSPTPRKLSVQGRASLDTCRGMTAWMYREKEWETQSWQPSSPWFSPSTPWLPLPSGSVRCPWAPALSLCFLLSYINSDSIWYLQTEFCIKLTHHSYMYSFLLHELIASLKSEA